MSSDHVFSAFCILNFLLALTLMSVKFPTWLEISIIVIMVLNAGQLACYLIKRRSE
jgi:uncharacterized membrane protein YhdT